MRRSCSCTDHGTADGRGSQWRTTGRCPRGRGIPGMSSRLGPCKIVHMAGSHEVMFTRPAELARTLVEAAYD